MGASSIFSAVSSLAAMLMPHMTPIPKLFRNESVYITRPGSGVCRHLCFLLFFCAILSSFAMGQLVFSSGVVFFWEKGFPAADIPQLTEAQASKIFSGYEMSGSADLRAHLATAHVLVMPFGSAFPESEWAAIQEFLKRGGSLVVLGGRPFTRPAVKDANGTWQLQPETQAFARELRIYGYQQTPASTDLMVKPNNEFTGPTLQRISWQKSWSLVLRLSEKAMDEREGSAGSLDAFLRPLLWGTREGRKLSAPVVEIDHTRNAFVGSRWELLTCEPSEDFWTHPETKSLVHLLVERAEQGPYEFRLQPQFAVFAAGEPWRFELHWYRPGAGPEPIRVELTIEGERGKSRVEHFDFTPSQLPFDIGFELKPSETTGLQHVTGRLLEKGHVSAVQNTGFWMRDDVFLRSGPTVSKDSDFFLIDGKPQPIVGTTYMASDVQRQYFEYPNPYVWDRDMEQIAGAGLNMLRTGWWTGWDRMTENGDATEKSLRALEAYLLTARKHKLPVQFTVFAFIPDVLGGRNSYLDPAAVAAQQQLLHSLVDRFHDVPYLMWDLINEPSFSNPKRTWITRPNGDEFELRAWNHWLMNRYRNRDEIAAAWHTARISEEVLVPLPTDADFSARGTMAGGSPARGYDYQIFAQEMFAAWSAKMRDTIRAFGNRQLVTVGQDEGGVTDRLLTAYFGSSVDFTTNHTWWLNDALLWDSLAAKQSGMPLLIQETGIQHETMLDGSPRLNDQQEAWLFERKLAIALGTSGGAIQWLWNTNAYMMPEMELSIGALRADGTEKPEADVLRRYATFAQQTAELFGEPASPEIVVVQSHAQQLSPYGEDGIAAQQRAVRVLSNDLHLSASLLAENRLAKLGMPKLVILPSAQALTQSAWDRLLAYVRAGGHLLVTGPVERDEHWSAVKRITALSTGSRVEPLLSHYSELQFGGERVPLSFNAVAQQHLERLTLPQFVVDLPLGSGHLYLTADPVELAEGPEATVRLYQQIARVLDLQPAFELKNDTHSVLIRATPMQDAILYLFVSEANGAQEIGVKDRATGVTLTVTLPAQRARLAFIRKSDHKIIWSPE